METNGNGYLPPQATELEEAVLGAAMLEKDGLLSLLGLIKTDEVFYKDAHRRIFQAIQKLQAKAQEVDILTVTQQLRAMGELEKIGGAYVVTTLTTRVNSSANLETHCLTLLEMHTRRMIIANSQLLIQKAYDTTSDPLEVLTESQISLNNLNDALSIKKARTMNDLYHEAFARMREATKAKGGVTGVPTGLKDVDDLTGGLQPSDLIILAARPGMGKTSIALQITRNTAIDFGTPVAFFSLEMGAVQLANKVIASESDHTTNELTKGTLAGGENTLVNVVATKTQKLAHAPIYIDDTASLTIGQFRAKAARMKAQHGIKLIVLDYLQLMSGDKSGRGGNREQEISSISRALKITAKELQIPIIALSQLSRQVETRADKRPMLSDLRESGAIEQDADVVAFLYRPEYYDSMAEDEMCNSLRGKAFINFAKHRNGGLEDILLDCRIQYGQFRDLNYFSREQALSEVWEKTTAKDLPPSDFEKTPPF